MCNSGDEERVAVLRRRHSIRTDDGTGSGDVFDDHALWKLSG